MIRITRKQGPAAMYTPHQLSQSATITIKFLSKYFNHLDHPMLLSLSAKTICSLRHDSLMRLSSIASRISSFKNAPPTAEIINIQATSQHGSLWASSELQVRRILFKIRPFQRLTYCPYHLLSSKCFDTPTYGFLHILSKIWQADIPTGALCRQHRTRNNEQRHPSFRTAGTRTGLYAHRRRRNQLI